MKELSKNGQTIENKIEKHILYFRKSKEELGMNERIDNLQGKLIVSCQALSNEPLHSSFIMGRMALAASTLFSVFICISAACMHFSPDIQKLQSNNICYTSVTF